MMNTAELFVDARNAVGESPVWLPEERALYWVDINNGLIHAQAINQYSPRMWALPEKVGCIAHIRANHWVAALESAVHQVTLCEDGSVSTKRMTSANHSATNMRFNDGRCDRSGH